VASEYARIRAGGSGSVGPDAIVLSDLAINNLFDHQAIVNEGILRHVFPDWDRFPADAQLGIFHHSWIRSSEAGIEGWQSGRYATAVRARQWDEAGYLSLWQELREGNRERHARRRYDVMRMFHNAALVDACRGAVPISWLFFPRDAAPTTEQYQSPPGRSQAAGAL
jgi:hypothetical protein